MSITGSRISSSRYENPLVSYEDEDDDDSKENEECCNEE